MSVAENSTTIGQFVIDAITEKLENEKNKNRGQEQEQD